MQDLMILGKSLWEKYLKAMGFVRGNISASNLDKLYDNEAKDHIKSITNFRAIILAYTRGNAKASAFFAKKWNTSFYGGNV